MLIEIICIIIGFSNTLYGYRFAGLGLIILGIGGIIYKELKDIEKRLEGKDA